MIRNLKVLIAAAMALAAFGAISASGAQAAEFHCSVEPCTITIKPDGPVPGKTSHHVFVAKQGANSISFTCDELTGYATSKDKTTKVVTFTNLQYHHCTTSGEKFNVRMNGCDYDFETPGVAPHNVAVTVTCPVGKKIELEIEATGCLVTIGETGTLSGIKVHDPETGGNKKTEITAEPTVKNIPAEVANNKCPAPLVPGAATGEYTTGNVELTGETHVGVHASLWWTA